MLYIDLPISTFIPLDVDNFGTVWYFIVFQLFVIENNSKKLCLFIGVKRINTSGYTRSNREIRN